MCLAGRQRAGQGTGSAAVAAIAVDPDADEAEAFGEPGDEAEGADELAVGAVGDDGQAEGEDDGEQDGRGLEAEVEEVEGVHEVIDDETALAAHDAEEE